VGFVLGLVLSGKGRKALSAEKIANRFLELVRADEDLRHFAVIKKYSDIRYYVSVLPIEEAVRFEQKKSDVYFSARTSSAGPGYHDYITGLLDDLLSVETLVATEKPEHLDETGYWSQRDFPALQAEMSKYFHMVAKVVVDKTEGGVFDPMGIGVRPGPLPKGFANKVLTLRGPRDRKFFELTGEASQIFPWWNFALPPSAAFGIAEAILWSEYRWRPAINGYEQAMLDGISALIRVANEDPRLDTNRRLNVLDFAAACNTRTPPPSTGMGYLKRSYRRSIGSGWSILVPGYFLPDTDDRTGAEVFNEEDQGIWPIVVSPNMEGRVMPKDLAGKKLDVSIVGKNVSYYGLIAMVGEGKARTHWLQGYAVGERSLVHVSVFFKDEAMKQWAIDALLSTELHEGEPSPTIIFQ
jgi:hypothetical protein